MCREIRVPVVFFKRNDERLLGLAHGNCPRVRVVLALFAGPAIGLEQFGPLRQFSTNG
jgi:hypothetical protein